MKREIVVFFRIKIIHNFILSLKLFNLLQGPYVECTTESASTPVTVAYLNITEWADEYRVSLIHGFNIPISIYPKKISNTKVGGFPIVTNWCERLICNSSPAETTCPNSLKKYNSNGTRLLGCMSVCDKYQTDQTCCKGEFKSPEKCLNYAKPSTKKKVDISIDFKVKQRQTMIQKVNLKQGKYIEYGEAVFKKFCPLGQSHVYQDFSLSYMHISMPSYVFSCKRTGYDLYFC